MEKWIVKLILVCFVITLVLIIIPGLILTLLNKKIPGIAGPILLLLIIFTSLFNIYMRIKYNKMYILGTFRLITQKKYPHLFDAYFYLWWVILILCLGVLGMILTGVL